MPTLRLTQAAVERLKPPATGRVEYWDNTLPGFGLRVSAPRPGQHDGRKVWQVMYRVNGRLVREKLGTLATLDKVEAARDLARASLARAERGIDPAAERQRAAAEERDRQDAAAARQRDTLAAVVDRYLEQHAAKRWRRDTYAEVKRCLDHDVKPALGHRAVHEIARREIRELLDGIVARGRAAHAHHVLAYLRPALEWAVQREILGVNPAVGIPDPDPRKREARTRDRYLDDDEIRLFWLSCDEIGWPFGPLFKLLLLTAQRRDELALASWAEFDLKAGLWTLPRERAKNNKAHLVHLSPLAGEILAALPKIGKAGLLFTTTGRSPVSGFGRARDRLAGLMLDRLRRERAAEGAAGENEAAPEIGHFTLHDLRRSAATGMARLGIAQHVVEKALNHTSGKISGVAATYNRFDYLDERKAALEAWSRHVSGLVRPEASNVVQLATAR